MSKGEGKDRTSIRKEIAIALFWRNRIGDFEYVKFDPDDVLRWHLELNLRGRHEIASLMAERYATYARRTPILGLVGTSPHPPAWIVHEWLSAQQPKFSKWHAVGFSVVFLTLAGTFAPILHTCQDLQTSNKLVYQPPNGLPMITHTTTQPNFEQQPASAQINTPFYSTGSPLAAGTGAAPPTVRTTPANTGISGGAAPP